MVLTLTQTFSSLLVVLTISLILRAKHQRGFKLARGPPSPSWLLGHEIDIRRQTSVGVNELKWIKEYGLVVRVAGCFGQQNLIVADPKALQYIFHTSGYRFPKTGDINHFMGSILGPGIVTVEGQEHRRQRHILTPAFAVGRLRTFLGLFQVVGEKLTEKLGSHLAGEGSVVDILSYTTKSALDVLGLSSLRHDFGSLDGKEDELGTTLKEALMGASMNPPTSELFYTTLLRLIPDWAIAPVDTLVASNASAMLRTFRTLVGRISNGIIQKAIDDPEGLAKKDIIGLLASSRLSNDEKKRMSQDAMMAQMATFIVGGQDTSSNTLGFLLYELARKPDAQMRLRDEICGTLERKNGQPLTIADYDAMPFLNACIKETLRFHSIAHTLIREASQDDVLPLSEPLTLEDGTTSMELPIKKGQVVFAHIYGYHRLESVWGKDADKWNPDRFMAEGIGCNGSNVGVYANLLTFGGGTRSCIGWRFALMELQVFTTLMVNKFSFEPDVEVTFAPLQVSIVAVVEGKYDEGTQVPLRIKALLE